jgi:hypothetical protein
MATKKRSKKARSPRGQEYFLTAKGVKVLAEITGQGRLIYNALKLMKKAATGLLVKRVGKRLDTKKPANVTASYLTKWRQAGLVGAKMPRHSAAVN